MVWGQNQNQNYGGNMGSMGMGNLNMQGMGNYQGSSMTPGGRGILGESPGGGSGGMGMGGYGGIQGLGGVGQSIMGNTGGSDIDSMIQQRRLQQQLSLRESQLALASNLLQKQNQLMMDVGLPGQGGGGGGGGGSMGMLPSPPMSRPMIPSLLDMPAQPRQGKRPVNLNRDMDFKRRRRDSSSSDQRGRNTDYDRRRDRDHFSPNRRRDEPPIRRDRPSRFSRRDSGETRWRSRKNSEEYDPADPTGDGDEMPSLELAEETILDDGRKTAVSEKSGFFCHVCDMDCSTDKNFRAHMTGPRHKERMAQALNVHEKKSNQIQARMKAQEHLKRIEKTRVGFCKLCDQELTIPFIRHKMTTLHKKREMQVHKGCGWCGVKNFGNFSQVLKHREKESHRENAAKYGKKRDNSSSSSSRQRTDSKSTSRTEKDLVTLDSVGFEKDDKKGRFRSSTSSRTTSKTSGKDEDPMPELKFKADVAVGQNYVIPVSGFFCKLCHKFYNTETAAKVSHCQSQQHFTMFKKAKIAAKAKAKAQKARPKSTSTPISDKTDIAKAEGETEDADNTMAELKKEEEKMEDEENQNEDGQETAETDENNEAPKLPIEEEMDVGESAVKNDDQTDNAEDPTPVANEDRVDENGDEKAEETSQVEERRLTNEEKEEEKLLEKTENESDDGGMVAEDIMFEEEGADDDGEMGIVDLAESGAEPADDSNCKGDNTEAADLEDSETVEPESADVDESETAAVETEESQETETVEETSTATRGRGRGRARRGKRGRK